MANSRRTIRPIRPITPLEPVNIQLGGVDPDIDWLADRLANLSKTAVQIGVGGPATLTAADNTAVDAVYDAVEQAVLENVRTRLNEIEALLQSLGLVR